MPDINLYSLVFSILIYALCARLLWYYIKGGALENSPEIMFYAVALLFNDLFHSVLPGSYGFNLVHVFMPVGVIGSFFLVKRLHPVWFFMVIALASLALLELEPRWLISLLNVLAIGLLLWKALKLARSRSREVKMAATYIVLALDMLLTFSLYQMVTMKSEWTYSEIMGYWSIMDRTIWLLVIIFVHVRFRRHYSN